MLRSRRFASARRALAGVEATAMLAKGQVRDARPEDAPVQRAYAHRLVGFAA